MQSDVANIRIAENGVIFLELPYFILSPKLQNTIPKAGSIVEPNLKTLFPLNWSKNFILHTAREIHASATAKELTDRTIIRTVED